MGKTFPECKKKKKKGKKREREKSQAKKEDNRFVYKIHLSYVN